MIAMLTRPPTKPPMTPRMPPMIEAITTGTTPIDLLRQHLDDDLLVRSRAQHRVDGRQMLIEPDIDDAAAPRRSRRDSIDWSCFPWFLPLTQRRPSSGIHGMEPHDGNYTRPG